MTIALWVAAAGLAGLVLFCGYHLSVGFRKGLQQAAKSTFRGRFRLVRPDDDEIPSVEGTQDGKDISNTSLQPTEVGG